MRDGPRGGRYEIEQSALASLPLPKEGEAGTVPASEAISMAVSQLGENLVLRRACVLPSPPEGGVVASYVHNRYVPGLGQKAAAVALRSQAEPAALTALGEKLAMHIVAASPQYLSRDEVDQAHLDRERPEAAIWPLLRLTLPSEEREELGARARRRRRLATR